MSKMLSAEEVAKKANVHIESVRRWIRQGKLPAALSSRYEGYRIKEDDLQAFLDKKNQVVKPKGYVEAETVLRSLASEWNGIDKGYIRIAYEVAKEAGILEGFRQDWDAWDGDLVAENANLLQDRLAYRDTWEDMEKVNEVEGKLILAEHKNKTI